MSTAAEKIQQKLEELTQKVEERGAEVQVLSQELARMQARGGRPDMGGEIPKTAGMMIVESEQFRAMMEHGQPNCAPIKMTMRDLSSSTVGALAPNPDKSRFSEIPQRRPRLMDLMVIINTNTDAVQYIRETGFNDLYMELAMAAASGQAVLIVKNASGCKVGSTLTIGSGASEESKIVDSIDYDKNEITLTTNLSNTHAIAVAVTSDEFIFTPDTQLSPSANLVTTEPTESVKTILVNVTVPRSVLDDAPRLQQILDQKLPAAVRRQVESQILNGDGTARELSGILEDSDIQTYTWSDGESGDTKIDASRRARTLAQKAHYDVDLLILNEDEWEDMELEKADGQYLLRNTPEEGAPDRLWRLAVVETSAIPSTTGLIGSMQAAPLYMRQDVDVQIYTQHKDYAARDLALIQAKMRVALTVERPESFVKIDFDAAP